MCCNDSPETDKHGEWEGLTVITLVPSEDPFRQDVIKGIEQWAPSYYINATKGIASGLSVLHLGRVLWS